MSDRYRLGAGISENKKKLLAQSFSAHAQWTLKYQQKKKEVFVITRSLKPKKPSLVISLYVLIFFVSGCAGIDSKYPNSWPAVEVASSTCPAVEGSYKTKGPATEMAPEESSFLKSRLGFSKDIALLTNVNIISLKKPEGDTLEIEAKADGTVVGRRVLSSARGEWRCENDRLFMADRKVSFANGTSSYFGTSKFSLSRAKNGALIGEETRSMVGVISLNPVIDAPHFWFMWPKAGQ